MKSSMVGLVAFCLLLSYLLIRHLHLACSSASIGAAACYGAAVTGVVGWSPYLWSFMVVTITCCQVVSLNDNRGSVCGNMTMDVKYDVDV